MSQRSRTPGAFGPALTGALLAVAASVPAAALLGAQFGDTYETRAAVYLGLLFWVVLGAVCVWLATWKSQPQRLTLSFVALWFASTWLWPLPLWMWWRRRRA